MLLAIEILNTLVTKFCEFIVKLLWSNFFIKINNANYATITETLPKAGDRPGVLLGEMSCQGHVRALKAQS